MGVVVTFDYTAWSALFPQFSNLTEDQVEQVVLPLAVQYNRNDGGGPICDAGVQTQALNLMVAHCAQILFGSATQKVSPLVGRVSSATEGSVSVDTDYGGQPASAAWFNQTPYGAAWWVLVKPYRLGIYAPKITPQVQPINLPYARFGWPGFR